MDVFALAALAQAKNAGEAAAKAGEAAAKSEVYDCNQKSWEDVCAAWAAGKTLSYTYSITDALGGIMEMKSQTYVAGHYVALGVDTLAEVRFFFPALNPSTGNAAILQVYKDAEGESVSIADLGVPYVSTD